MKLAGSLPVEWNALAASLISLMHGGWVCGGVVWWGRGSALIKHGTFEREQMKKCWSENGNPITGEHCVSSRHHKSCEYSQNGPKHVEKNENKKLVFISVLVGMDVGDGSVDAYMRLNNQPPCHAFIPFDDFRRTSTASNWQWRGRKSGWRWKMTKKWFKLLAKLGGKHFGCFRRKTQITITSLKILYLIPLWFSHKTPFRPPPAGNVSPAQPSTSQQITKVKCKSNFGQFKNPFRAIYFH